MRLEKLREKYQAYSTYPFLMDTLAVLDALIAQKSALSAKKNDPLKTKQLSELIKEAEATFTYILELNNTALNKNITLCFSSLLMDSNENLNEKVATANKFVNDMKKTSLKTFEGHLSQVLSKKPISPTTTVLGYFSQLIKNNSYFIDDENNVVPISWYHIQAKLADEISINSYDDDWITNDSIYQTPIQFKILLYLAILKNNKTNNVDLLKLIDKSIVSIPKIGVFDPSSAEMLFNSKQLHKFIVPLVQDIPLKNLLELYLDYQARQVDDTLASLRTEYTVMELTSPNFLGLHDIDESLLQKTIETMNVNKLTSKQVDYIFALLATYPSTTLTQKLSEELIARNELDTLAHHLNTLVEFTDFDLKAFLLTTLDTKPQSFVNLVSRLELSIYLSPQILTHLLELEERGPENLRIDWIDILQKALYLQDDTVLDLLISRVNILARIQYENLDRPLTTDMLLFNYLYKTNQQALIDRYFENDAIVLFKPIPKDPLEALRVAINKSDDKIVDKILEKKINIKHQFENGDTFLLLAAKQDNMYILKTILKHSEKSKDSGAFEALVYAIQQKKENVIRTFIKSDAIDLDKVSISKLRSALLNTDKENRELLLTLMLDPNNQKKALLPFFNNTAEKKGAIWLMKCIEKDINPLSRQQDEGYAHVMKSSYLKNLMPLIETIYIRPSELHENDFEDIGKPQPD